MPKNAFKHDLLGDGCVDNLKSSGTSYDMWIWNLLNWYMQKGGEIGCKYLDPWV